MHEQNSKHTHHGSEQIKLPLSHPRSNPTDPVSPDSHQSLTAQNLLATQPQDIVLKVQDSVTVKQPEPARGEAFLKGAWSLFSVAIVPLVLFWIGHEVEKANEETAQNTRESESLNSYVDSIGNLLLSQDIERTDQSKIDRLILSKSLLITRQVGGARKGQVVRFLYDQELIFSENEIERREREVIKQEASDPNNPTETESERIKKTFRRVDLGGLDLVEVDLNSAFIPGINLSSTAMRQGKLSNVNLIRSNLSGADLSGADLSGADLSGADLNGADLSNAKFQDAKFTDKTTTKETCGTLSLLKENAETCPTIFPDSFEPISERMILVE